MLRSLDEVKGYVLKAQDGEIGRCDDFLIDEEDWAVRYMVADTSKWLPGRKVLITPIALDEPEWPEKRFPVQLTQEQIKKAPDLAEHAPVSRQYEIWYHKHYGWPYYWQGGGMWATSTHPQALFSLKTGDEDDGPDLERPHIHSAKEVMGYAIRATDGDIGHLEDFILDDETWSIRYVVLATRNWLPGKKVLMPLTQLKNVDWKNRAIDVSLTREAIKDYPEYDSSLPVNHEVEEKVYDFVGRPPELIENSEGNDVDSLEQYLDLGELLTGAVSYFPQLISGLLIVVAFWTLYRVTRRPLRAALRHTGLHEKLVSLLVGSIYRYSLAAFGLVMALSQLGVNVGAAIAGLGVAGIAVGLAAQDTLSNTIAGFTIFWDKPFIVGDWVTVSEQYGKVNDITLRSTRIRTPRNSFVVIPNKRIIDEVLINHTKNGRLRVDVPIGIAYKESTHDARQVLLEAVRDLDQVLSNPEPEVVVKACADSSVNLDVRVWVDDARHKQGVTFSVIETSKNALDKAGIEIPFPHLQLFFDDVQDRVVEKFRGSSSGAA